MRSRFLLVVLCASGLAFAFSPEELLTQREVKISCDEKTHICQISEQDLEWMVGRDRLLSVMTMRLYERLQSCRGEKVT